MGIRDQLVRETMTRIVFALKHFSYTAVCYTSSTQAMVYSRPLPDLQAVKILLF